MDKPLVTIRCITYNHEPYIRQCLEGFVMQKTNFSFEVIVHDDASTDGTVEIIREYAEKYPNIIKPIYETENQYSKNDGSIRRIIDEAMSPEAKYIAMCEGDDYWIDPLKLQKQVDYLENHPDVVYSCHRYKILIDRSKEIYLAPNIYFDKAENTGNKDFEFDIHYTYRTKDWITKTLTSLYRREACDSSFENQFKYYRDVHKVYGILLHGKGVCHSFIGGVYRINSESVFGGRRERDRLEQNIKVYKELYSVTKDFVFKNAIERYYYSLTRKYILKSFPPKDKLEWSLFLKYPIADIKWLVNKIKAKYNRKNQ